ncbi:hypothetical protein EYZ11_009878 [Aspergillus tanneri]|uniref:Squalene cyclase C-terminal domain-containing protein n=1 Tax=Aspergillus tanneri TaxID=1220188 RepID=A0A4S3J6S2_9EURO|nr:hypothetical protein EYZ11_009878 [Aspergillus tanneri]
MVKQDPNLDGGWAAFDRENNYLFLNKIPFSDMDSFCDPSTADVTGRVLECFGLLVKTGAVLSKNGKNPIPQLFIERMSSATERAIDFLSTEQDSDGPWHGRWGSNYIYGTSTVLCGLVYHLEGWDDTYPVMEKKHKADTHAALDWLKRVQNPDGGWGERLETYNDPSLAGNGPSTASQTAWALMALPAYLPPTDSSITRGIQYLSQTQIKEGELTGSWKEDHYTGTGFPNHSNFAIPYTLNTFP